MTQQMLVGYGPTGFRVTMTGPEGPVEAMLGIGAAGPVLSTLGPFNTIVAGAAGSGRLIDIPTAQFLALPNGTLAWVESVQAYFYRLTSPSSVSSDSITILKPLGGVSREIWVRLPNSPNYWASRPGYFINAAAGSDENTGLTALLPLKTFAELKRRIPGGTTINVALVITYAGNGGAADPIYTADWLLGSSGSISVLGTTTNTRAASTFTAVAGPVRAGAMAPTTVTDATIGSFAAFVGQRMRITASADPTHVGAVAFVIRASAANKCECTGFIVPRAYPAFATDSILPSVGDTFVIETLSTLQLGDLGGLFNNSQFPTAYVNARDLTLVGANGFAGFVSGSLTEVEGCYCQGIAFHSDGGINVRSCILDTCASANYSPFGLTILSACGIINQTFFASGNVWFDDDTYAEGVGLVNVSTSDTAMLSFGRCACFRSGGAAGAYIGAGSTVVSGGLFFAAAAFYGSGNGVGIQLESHASFNYVVKPTITGTVNDTVIGGTAKALAALPFIEPANAAAIVVWL